MKKETLLEIILGTVGGFVFAIGMCMCLIPEWDLLKVGADRKSTRLNSSHMA